MVDRVIRIVLDADDLKRGLTQIKGRMQDVGKETKRTGESMRTLRTFAGGLIAALGLRELVRYADQWTTIGNRIRLVTDGTEEYNTVQDRLVGLAQRTRTDLNATVELYARVARSTDNLGASQEEVLTFTEAVNQALQISGATAAEAGAGVIQFAQGLASGALRGDELRSVLEQMPRLASALAEELGVTIGELRLLGNEGKLSADKIFEAVLNAAPKLQAEFDVITPTIGQALTTVKNFATTVIGSFNEAAGVTAGLVEIFALTDETTMRLGASVRSLGLDFREFVEVATIATANFLETVAPSFGIVQAEIVKVIAALTRDEDLFRAAMAGQDELLGQIEDIKSRLGEEFDLIAKNAAARRAEFEAREADLAKRGDVRGGTGLDPQALRDAEKLRKEQERLLEGLLQQEAALAIVAETGREYASVLLEIKINTLAAKNANEAFRFDSQETREEIERLTSEIKAQADAESERQARLDRASEITLDARTEQEKFNDSLRELQGLLDDGLITEETFDRAKDNLSNLDDSLADFFRRARENSQDILAGFLESGLQNLDDFATEFSQMLLRLASQALAADIFAKILGPKDGGGGFDFLGAIGSLFGGGAAASGQFGSGVQAGQAINVSEGGRFGSEVFVPNQGGQVIPLGTDRGAGAAMPAPVVQLTNVNAFSEQDVVAAFQTGGGEQVVLNMVSARQRSFRQALGIA